VTTKLSYKDQRELEQLPEKISVLEEKMADLQKQINQPDFFSMTNSETQPVLDELANIEEQISTLYMRWETLE